MLPFISRAGISAPWSDTGLAYEQIVATGGHVPVTALTSTSTKTRIDWRQACKFGGKSVSKFRLAFANYYCASDLENAPGNVVYVEADVEMPGAPFPGPVRVRFSGAYLGAMADGVALFESDNLPASAFGYTVIPAGTTFYVNGSVSVAAVGQKLLYTVNYAGLVGEGAVTSGSSRARGGAGSAPAIALGGAALVGTGPLIAVIGTFTAPEVSLIFGGDSITAYQADVFASGLDGASGGVVVRGAYSVGGRTIPWSSIAVSGSTLIGSSTNYTKRLALAAYATHAVCNLATNDWAGSAGTPAVATMLAAVETMAAALRAAGVLNVDWVNCIPRTTGTFTTAAGQTPLNSNYQAGGFRDQFNAGLAAQTHVGGVIDLDSALRDPTITDAFQANFTNAGTHPVGGGLTAGAAVFASRFATYVGGQP